MRPIGFTGRCVGTKQLFCGANTLIGPTTKSKAKFEASSCMPEPDLIELFVRPLNELGIRYLVSGSVSRDEIDSWAFRNANHYSIKGMTINLAPPEYVIVRKLEFYREGGSEKHLRDIRSMLAVSGDQIDKSELNEWIQRRGVHEQWRKIQS